MKARERLIIIAALIAISAVIIIAGCGNRDDGSTPAPAPDNPQVNGPVESDTNTYIITGARDYYIGIAATAEAIDLSLLKAEREESGGVYAVTADFSGVKFGTKGMYTAIYSCGQTKVEKQVYVYDSTVPEIKGVSDKTVSASADLAWGVSATDQFGFSVSVIYTITVNGIESDVLRVGENTVTYTAIDLVGNIATAVATVTVN